MAYKMKGSPLKQGIMGNIFAANQQPANVTSTIGNLANSALSNQWASQNFAPTTPQSQTSGTVAPTVAPAKTKVKYDMTKPGRIVANPQTSTTPTPSTEMNVPSTKNITTPNPGRTVPARAKTITPAQPAPINPKAVGNADMVKNVYGVANPDTFTRTVQGNEAPIMQLANPDSLQDGPELPPQGVQTSVTPTLGFENS